MMDRALRSLGLLTVMGSLAMACSHGTVDGELQGQEFGKVRTAFFDTYDNEDGGALTIFLYDYEWTCEEIQQASDDGEELWPEDSDQVVGGLSIVLLKWNADEYTFEVPTATGAYKVFDFYNPSDYQNLDNGDLLAFLSVSFANESGAVEAYDFADNGAFELIKLDLEKTVAGEFDVTLSDSDAPFAGKFKAEPCDIL